MKVGTDGVLLGAWAEVHDSKNILDIGTGCGLIALMAAQRSSSAIIDAIDIDNSSVEEARSNFKASPWGKRMNAYHSSLQDLNPQQKYDHILSNPPFFTHGTKSPTAARERARHTVALPINELVKHAVRLLDDNGKLSVIIPYDIETDFLNYCDQAGLYLKKKTLFYSKYGNKPERSLLCISKMKCKTEEDSIVHYNEDGIWSDDYKALTKDYHIKL